MVFLADLDSLNSRDSGNGTGAGCETEHVRCQMDLGVCSGRITAILKAFLTSDY